MIRLKRLVIRDFGPIEEFDTRFKGSGTIAVVGANGVGKTHFVEALRITCTAIGKGKPLGAYVRNYGVNGEVAKVTAWYDVDGKELEVTRTISIKKGEDVAAILAEGALPNGTSRSSVRMEDFNDGKALAASAEVDAFLADTFGISNETQASSVFVLQDQGGKIWGMDPIKRKTAFQSLAGTDTFNDLSKYVTNKLAFFHVGDYTADHQQAVAELDRIQKEVAEAEEQLSTITKPDPMKVRELHKLLASAKRAEERAALVESVQVAKTFMDQKQSELLAVESQSSGVVSDEALAELRKAAQAAEALLRDEDQSSRARAERANANESLVQAINVLQAAREKIQSMVPPAPTVDELKTSIGVLTAHVDAQRKEYQRVDKDAQFLAGGACPTCGNTDTCPHCHKPLGYLAQAKDKVQTELSGIVAAGTQKAAELSSAQSLLQPALKAQAEYDSAKKNFEAASRLKEQADSRVSFVYNSTPCPYPEPVDPEYLMRARTTVDNLYAMEADYAKRRTELQAARTAYENARTRYETLVSTVTDVNDVVHVEDVEAVKAQLQQLESASLEYGRLEGRMETLRKNLKDSQDRVAVTEKKVRDNLVLVSIVDLLQEIKAATHPTALPLALTGAYINTINTHLTGYARDLGLPFNLFVDPQTQDLMYQDGQFLTAARHRLSRGQFTMATWAWHLALRAVHAGSVGFMVMDEPTTGLDVNNRAGVAVAIENMASYCQGTGTQFIMVTHDIDIATVFNERLFIGERQQLLEANSVNEAPALNAPTVKFIGIDAIPN